MVSADRARYAPHAGGVRGTRRTFVDHLSRVAQWLRRAQQRSVERHRLADMPDHRLSDLGITREQALRESRKPGWLE